MTDQEIIDKAVTEITIWQGEVNKREAEHRAKVARFNTLVSEVTARTGCTKVTAEGHINAILNPRPQTTDGERILASL